MEDSLDTKNPLELVDQYEEPEGRGLTDFFFPLPAPRTTWGIIRWWEWVGYSRSSVRSSSSIS
jgi:hypothetical protein